MIIRRQYFVFDDVFEPFEVNDEARHGIWITGNCDFEGVVVAMSVAPGAAAKDLLVLLLPTRRRSSSSARRKRWPDA